MTSAQEERGEMDRRRASAISYSRGLEPVTRNEMLEMLDALAMGDSLAIRTLIGKFLRRWGMAT